MARILAVLTLLLFGLQATDAWAQVETANEIRAVARDGFVWLIQQLDAVLFWNILTPYEWITGRQLPDYARFPLVVGWLAGAGLFFTFRLGFVNIRLFRHAFGVAAGKYDHPDDPGQVTHFQALSAAVSGTVGLGSIAGVAVAITTGGPGAVPWMMIAGFLGMTLKFSEVTLSLKYREIDEKGEVSGGPFHYLRKGLAGRGLPGIGRGLAVLFAIFCVGGAIGGGNMFQSNQASSMLTSSLGLGDGGRYIVAFTIASLVAVVLIGGVTRIAHVTEKIVPLKAGIYIIACIVVIVANAEKLPETIALIFREAFTPEAFGGGLVGAMIIGLRRACFACEAGIGSAPIIHAAARTSEPVREGVIALIEPFLDAVIICALTGIVITITGVWKSGHADGALLTSQAFATVIDWFPYVLTLCITLFAYSTTITWSYYGLKAWTYLFGKGRKREVVYYLFFCGCTFFGAILPGKDFKLVVDFSDLLLLSMALPNLLGVFLLRRELIAEVKSYTRRLKAGEFNH